MVNNLRKYAWSPSPSLPLPEGRLERRVVGPRYDLEVVKGLTLPDSIRPMTEQVEGDLEGLRWDVDDVASLIQALTPDDYHASEWTQVSHRMVVDADAYAVNYDHLEQVRNPFMVKYYVKFGFANNSLLLLLVSCHLERPRL